MRQHDAGHPLYDNVTVPVPATSDGGFFPVQASYVNLGNVQHSDGSSSSRYILRSSWAKPELKGPLFIAVVLPVLLSWFIDAAVAARTTAFYNGRVRSMCRLIRLRQRDLHVNSTELLRRLRIQPVHFFLRRRQLQWCGDIALMPATRLPRRMVFAVPIVSGSVPSRTQGRPRVSTRTVIADALAWAGVDADK